MLRRTTSSALLSQLAAEYNDLKDGDDGCGGERVVRRRREAADEAEAVGDKRKAKAVEMETLDLGDGHVWTWPKTQAFEIERILDKRMLPCKVGTVRLAVLTSCPRPSA